MTPVIILKDKDIFADAVDDSGVQYVDRAAVKVILFDVDGKIALVGKERRLLPGGGVEEGEGLIEAAVRECREETGCDVLIEKEIGFSEEYRAELNRHQVTTCFVAKVVGEKGLPTSEQEDEKDMQVEWFSLDDALALLESQVKTITSESYHACFNVRTHLAFLKKYKLEIYDGKYPSGIKCNDR